MASANSPKHHGRPLMAIGTDSPKEHARPFLFPIGTDISSPLNVVPASIVSAIPNGVPRAVITSSLSSYSDFAFYVERRGTELKELPTRKEAVWTFEGTDISFFEFVKSKPHLIRPLIAKGAYGSVFLVTTCGKTYIIKYMKLQGVDSINKEVALDEIQNLIKVNGSPFALQIEVAIVLEDSAYICSPYVPGKTFKDWLSANPSKTERIRVYNQLLEGIADIHARGLVHRDIKSSNIWVPDDTSRPAFYLDFGISVPLGSTYVYLGTERYKRPEAFGEGPQLADLNYHALGVLFKKHSPNMPLNVNLTTKGLRNENVRGHRFTRRGGHRRRRMNTYRHVPKYTRTF